MRTRNVRRCMCRRLQSPAAIVAMSPHIRVRYAARLMRLLLVTPADDPAQYAVPRDGVSDGLSAPARRRPRARGDAGRRLDRAVPAAVLRAARHAHGRGAAPAREGRRQARRGAAVDRALPRARRALRRNRRAGDPLPAAPRSEHGVPHRRPRVSSRRAALRAGARRADPLPRSARSARRSRRATSRACTSTTSPTSGAIGIDPRFELARYGEKLAASSADVRSAARGADGRADARRRNARRDHARAAGRAAAGRRRHHRALPRQRLRRVSHGAHDPRGEPEGHADSRRRLGQHRAALAARSARVRLLRLRHAR